MGTLINTGIFLIIIGATAWVKPAIEEVASKRDYIKQQQQQRRLEKAAQEMCGNGVASIDGIYVTCKLRKTRGK